MEERICTVIHSSFVAARRLTANEYSLSGDAFQMTNISSGQVLILPDDAEVTEGQAITPELVAQS